MWDTGSCGLGGGDGVDLLTDGRFRVVCLLFGFVSTANKGHTGHWKGEEGRFADCQLHMVSKLENSESNVD